MKNHYLRIEPGNGDLSIDYTDVLHDQLSLSNVTQYTSDILHDFGDVDSPFKHSITWWNPGCSYSLIYANKSIIDPLAIQTMGWDSDVDQIWQSGDLTANHRTLQWYRYCFLRLDMPLGRQSLGHGGGKRVYAAVRDE